MVDFSALKPFFTEWEIRAFFGARKQHEVDEAAQFIGGMSKDDQRKFKTALYAFNTMRLTEKSYAKQS
jgi:N-methylhydantoinase B/oxoprolinase/acetone carboxylase alpha subunit